MFPRNKLLASLPRAALDRLGTHLVRVPLPFKKVLYGRNEVIANAYFVESGVVSMVNEPNPGHIVEFATVGPEGVVGLPLLLGDTTTPSTAVVQIPGEGYLLPGNLFRETLDAFPQFRTLLMRYTLALFTQIAQSASCNRLHEVQERCARWLLQTHDRVDKDEFPLTQEFLAQMLGVHRPTVSVAAGMLQKAGLISYSRGAITILDRKGLEEASCSCYRVIVSEYGRLLG
jgi:CRP-like cAMP-binding protein